MVVIVIIAVMVVMVIIINVIVTPPLIFGGEVGVWHLGGEKESKKTSCIQAVGIHTRAAGLRMNNGLDSRSCSFDFGGGILGPCFWIVGVWFWILVTFMN